MRDFVRLRAALTLLCLWCGPLSTRVAAQFALIRGTVADSAGLAIFGATVTAISGTDTTASRFTRSDSTGVYRILVRPAVSYILTVHALGFREQRRAVNAPSDGSSIVANFQLAEVPQAMPAVRVRAKRPRQIHDADHWRLAPGVRRAELDVASGLDGDLTGDLFAALAMVPGVTLVTGVSGRLEPSAFGVNPDQNGTTLNGSDFGDRLLPRDGLVRTVRLATYDPKYGRFGGLQVNSELPSGSNTDWRTMHLTLDDPSLQWPTVPSAGLGTEYQDVILSGRLSGPLSYRKKFYSTAFQFERRTHDLATLGTANASALAALGINADSVPALLASAAAIGLPVASPRAPSAVVTTSGSAMARVDLTPAAGPILTTTDPVVYVMASGSFENASGLGVGPAALASRASHSAHRSGELQFDYAPYFFDLLNQSKLTLFTSSDRSDGDLAMPGVSLLLLSQLSGAVSPADVLLGGSAGAQSSAQRSGAQFSNETSWMTLNGAHTFNAYLDAEVERDESSEVANRLGTFSFNSLQDLSAGIPASFTRRFGTMRSSGTTWRAAIALSDVQAVTHASRTALAAARGGSKLTLQYGVRVDLEHFGERPAYNTAVDSLFGVRNDHRPNGVWLSPMVGFTWTSGAKSTLVQGRDRITGGIREYRGSSTAASVAGIASETGLPSGIQQIQCIGSAVPAPDWPAYAASVDAIPSACTDRSATSPLVQTAPSVLLYAPDYGPLQSWRGEINWRRLISDHVRGTLGTTYTLNIGGSEAYDLNFNPAVQTPLSDEGDRPVYASDAGIVAGTGVVSTAESRASSAFTNVLELRSGLRSWQQQLTAGLEYFFGRKPDATAMAPAGSRLHGSVNLSYTYARGRQQSNGFSGTTSGDPRLVSWSPAFAPQHTIQLVASGQLDGWFTISAVGRVSSGYRYQPMVGSDINGDGYANDRAFVFDPTGTEDAGVATGMAQLLASAPTGARRCLQRQLGAIAAPASCEGPWSATLGTISLMLDPDRIGLGNRGSVTIYLNNALGGLDRLLHGESNAHGWGQPAIPDSRLLTVRGFDPGEMRFLYDLNPRFGSTSASRFAGLNPFRVTLDVRLELAPPWDRQSMRDVIRDARDSTTGRLRVEDLMRQLRYQTSRTPVLSDIDDILGWSDSLHLTDRQVDSITALQKSFKTAHDSIYASLAHYLVTQNATYASPGVWDVWRRDVAAAMWKEFDTAMAVRQLLTARQIGWLEDREIAPTLNYTREWMRRRLRLSFPE